MRQSARHEPAGRRISVDGNGAVDLHCVDAGSGDPPLVLVHGYLGSTLDWADVFSSLAEAGRVIAYDHRGYGLSTNTGDAATYTFDRLVADLHALVQALDLPAFDLLGHSMGGVVAQRYLLDHPERVRSAILMDTSPEMAGFLPIDLIDLLAAMGREKGMSAVLELVRPAAEAAMLKGTGQVSEERRQVLNERMAEKFSQIDPEAFSALGHELNTYPSMTGRLGEISCPVTVMVGENDESLRGAADLLADGIAGAELVVMEDSGHCPQEDHPDAWLAVIERHLGRVG